MNRPAWTAPVCLFAIAIAPTATAQTPKGQTPTGQSPTGQSPTVSAPTAIDVGDDYRISVALGDVDGDGIEDLVVGRNGRFDLRRGLSRQPRRFAAARPLDIEAGPTCENACEPRLVDVDRDGDLDLLTLCAGLGGIGVNALPVWFANDGTGSFATRTELRAPDGRSLPRDGSRGAVELLDWDGDGVRDLLVSTPALVLHRGVAGGFQAEAVPIGATSRGFAAVDWDGDGDLDLLTQDRDGVHVLQRDGDRLQPRRVAELDAPNVPLRIAAADWDGDGRPDVLLGNHRRVARLELSDAVLAAERQQLRAAKRMLDVVHDLLTELNRTRPPLDDPDAMARRQQWREELQEWARAPRELNERLSERHRRVARPQFVGVVQVLRQ